MNRLEAEAARADAIARVKTIRTTLESGVENRKRITDAQRVALQDELREVRMMIRSLTSLIGDSI